MSAGLGIKEPHRQTFFRFLMIQILHWSVMMSGAPQIHVARQVSLQR
jgi:hypothetical protein